MSMVRVRFAPSPTGFLHIGNVRAALYNWLWARQQGGAFVLRIEDTDRERSTEAAVQVIFDSLRWLGLDWDEGPLVGGPHAPYFQMQRLAIYREFAQRLIAKGAAYRCYCTAEEIQKARDEHKARTGAEHGFRYPGTCRNRKDEPDLPYTVRIKVPESGSVAWDDLIKGRLEFANASQQDAVLIRQNGVPLYNLGVTVDDITMGITLVARGDDHVINTPQQILIYQALGEPLPRFAHAPMILGARGEKLSKRDASVAVLDYRDQGFLADGLLNYLVRLGWSHGDQEIFTRAELIEKFNWEHVGKTGGRWDQKKLLSVQSAHLHMSKPEKIAELCAALLAARGLEVQRDDARLVAAVALVMPRATTLPDVAAGVDYFFRDPPELDQAAAQKLLTRDVADKLDALAVELQAIDAFERGALEVAVKAWLERSGLALEQIAQAARVALTGRKASPGLFEVMEVLGRERVAERLRAGAAIARAR